MGFYRHAVAVVVGVTVVGSSILGAQASASASEQVDLHDGHTVLSEIAPTAVWPDSPTTTTTVTPAATSARVLARTNAAAAAVGGPAITVSTTPADSAPMSVGFHLDGATTETGTDAGVTSFATSDADVARYVSEAPEGASVVTAYAAAQAGYVSTTTFDFAPGEHPQAKPGGGYYLTDGTDVFGSIAPAWAEDAAGQSLPTSYRWDGSTLVQTVDVPASAQFPVVADPAWSYTWTAVVKFGSPKDLHTRMHSCFNCIFPVTGAPKAFPTPGTDLPLTVSAVGIPGVATLNFHCTFGQEQYLTANPLYPNGDFAFYFNAAKGHVDGLGSMISFDWWTGASDPVAGEKMRFTVTASIVNSNPAGVPRAVYEAGAKSTWAKFVSTYMLDYGAPDGSWYWTN
jgi:hypothetical protein